MKCGMFGPVADRIAREQLGAEDERYRITGSASMVEIFDEEEMNELLDEDGDLPDLMNADEAMVAARDACKHIQLPSRMFLITLTNDAGGQELTGFVQFTAEQHEEVGRTMHEWKGN